MLTEILQIVVILAVLTLLVVPTGKYISNIFTSGRHLLPERLTYRLLGVDPEEEMSWKRYAVALVLASGAAMLLGYVLLRLQSYLPLNPLGLPPQDPDQAFNSAASFDTTTNWQSYVGEISLSYFNQMAFVTFLQVFAPATGLAAFAALTRGLARSGFDGLGNFWVDLTRYHLPPVLAAGLRAGARFRLAGRAADVLALRRRPHRAGRAPRRSRAVPWRASPPSSTSGTTAAASST